jgi:hypothetical protein
MLTSSKSKLRLKLFGPCLVLYAALALIDSFHGTAFAIDTFEVTDPSTPIHRIALSMIAAYRETDGQFDALGNYTSNPSGSSVYGLYDTFHLAYRFSHAFELGWSFSARESRAAYSTGSQKSQSFGNPSLEARYHFNFPNPNLPRISVYTGFSMPYTTGSSSTTGDPSKALLAVSQTNADGTYAGGWTIQSGVGASKVFHAINLRTAVDASVTYPFPQTVDTSDGGLNPGQPDITSKRAIQYALSEGVAYLWGSHWSFDLGFRQLWAGDSTYDGQDTIDTATRLYSTSFGISFSPSTVNYSNEPDWRYSIGYLTPWPFYAALANEPYAPSISVGISYSGF